MKLLLLFLLHSTKARGDIPTLQRDVKPKYLPSIELFVVISDDIFIPCFCSLDSNRASYLLENHEGKILAMSNVIAAKLHRSFKIDAKLISSEKYGISIVKSTEGKNIYGIIKDAQISDSGRYKCITRALGSNDSIISSVLVNVFTIGDRPLLKINNKFMLSYQKTYNITTFVLEVDCLLENFMPKPTSYFLLNNEKIIHEEISYDNDTLIIRTSLKTVDLHEPTTISCVVQTMDALSTETSIILQPTFNANANADICSIFHFLFLTSIFINLNM